MARSNRFFQKSIFACVLMAFIALTCSVWGEEVTPANPATPDTPATPATPAQKKKLDKINNLMEQLSAEGLTDQQKAEIMSEIMELTAELADEAKMTGNVGLAGEVLNVVNTMTTNLAGLIQASPVDPAILSFVAEVAKTAAHVTQAVAETAKAAGSTELAGQVLNTVNSITGNLTALVQASSAEVNILVSVAEATKSSAQITQTVAETAKATNNKDLAQKTVTVTGSLKKLGNQIISAAQEIAATSADPNTVTVANSLIQNVRQTEETSIQNAENISVQAGATPQAPENVPPTTAPEQTLPGDQPPDEPVEDSNSASPS